MAVRLPDSRILLVVQLLQLTSVQPPVASILTSASNTLENGMCFSRLIISPISTDFARSVVIAGILSMPDPW